MKLNWLTEMKRYIWNVLSLATFLAAFTLPGAAAADDDWRVSGKVDFNYEFSRVNVGVGYRILAWQFDGKGLIDDLRFSGPYAGMSFNFK